MQTQPTKVTNPQLFAKILMSISIKHDLESQYLLSYDWEIMDFGGHYYHVIGSHPIFKRLDYYNHFYIA